MPLPPPLLTLLGKIIGTERSKRDRVVDLKAREVANTFPAGHGGRLVAVDRACAEELEYRAKEWLSVARRVLVETRTPWTATAASDVSHLIETQLVVDWNALVAVLQALPGRPAGALQSPSLDAAKQYSLAMVANELQLLVLREEGIRVPLDEQFRAPRYAAVRQEWSAAADDFHADQPQYRDAVLHSIRAVEELARILINDGSATLGRAIKELQRTGRLPAPILSSLEELWGWASNEPGLRHGASSSEPVDAAAAAYVLKLAEGVLILLLQRDDA